MKPSGERRPARGGWVCEDPALEVGLKLCPENAGPEPAAPGRRSFSRILSFQAANQEGRK